MRQLIGSVLLALVAGPAGVRAQERPLDAPGLRTYVREVLALNSGLRADVLRALAATDRIAPAGALPDPMVTVGAMSVPVTSFDFAREPMTQVPTVALQQRFPFPGKQGAATAVARAESTLAGARVAANAAELVATAARAWYGLAFAREALRVWEARVILADQAVAVARSRYETGAAPQTDLLRAQLRRAQLAEQGLELEALVTEARARADALRGGSGGDITTALQPPTDSIPRATDTLLVQASPVLSEAATDREHARRVARTFAIAARPDFTVSLQNGVRLGGREPFLSAMIGVSVPLWAGRKQGPAARAAELDATAAAARYEDLFARLRGEVRGQRAHLDALQNRIALTADEIVPLADGASQSALQRYQVGAVEFTAVLDAQDDVYGARLQFARLIADYGTVRARFAALIGEEWYR